MSWVGFRLHGWLKREFKNRRMRGKMGKKVLSIEESKDGLE